MKAWVVHRTGPLETADFRYEEVATPEPGPGEVRLRVLTCGVCHTDLHVIEGDLPGVPEGAIPGHQVVGIVEALGPGVRTRRLGERVGVPWFRGACGKCRYCRKGRENLCPNAEFNGYTRPGGYAEFLVVPETSAYRLPAGYDDVQVAPLLCGGVIGYRALRRTLRFRWHAPWEGGSSFTAAGRSKGDGHAPWGQNGRADQRSRRRNLTRRPSCLRRSAKYWFGRCASRTGEPASYPRGFT